MKKQGLLANARISKILDMSRDFQAHRNNIMNIQNRSMEEKRGKQRADKIQRLLQEKGRYFCNVQNLKLVQLQRDNDRIVSRLQNIHRRDPKKLSKSNSNHSLGTIRLQQTSSSKSLNQSFRRSQSRRIIKQNLQLADRIIKSKPRPYFLHDKLKKQYARQQQYVRSISRYSEKNRMIVTSIVKKGLKLKPQIIGFLPNINKEKSQTSRTPSQLS